MVSPAPTPHSRGVPLLIIDCYLTEAEGAENFEVLLPDDRPYRILRATSEEIQGTPEDYAGILISGSGAMITESPSWVTPLASFLRDSVDAGVPVFGICFGHQLIAEAICGQGSVRKSATPEVGWFSIRMGSTDAIALDLPETFTTFLSHYEEVRPDLKGIDILAQSDRCAVQALRIQGAPAWGVQFHPEMRAAETERIVRGAPERRPDLRLDVEETLAEAVDSAPLARQLVANFLKAVDQRAQAQPRVEDSP